MTHTHYTYACLYGDWRRENNSKRYFVANWTHTQFKPYFFLLIRGLFGATISVIVVTFFFAGVCICGLCLCNEFMPIATMALKQTLQIFIPLPSLISHTVLFARKMQLMRFSFAVRKRMFL